MAEDGAADGRAGTGVGGLDEVLNGGLVRDRLYLVEGTPGAGKTTLAMQFLIEGARCGEKGLYLTLAETADELRSFAASHDWELPENLEIHELLSSDGLLDDGQQQSLLYSSDLELGETTQRVFDAVERSRPRRIVLDSLSEIRLLAQHSLRYRRQVLALKHYFTRHGATVMLLDDMTAEAGDRTVHSIAHAVLRLEELTPGYGAERRRLRVVKYRASVYRGGFHDFRLAHGGVTVFPRLRSVEHRAPVDRRPLASGVAALDALLGGGIDRGTSALLLGPAGAGKSTLALLFAAAAVARGERAAVFVFDEELGLLMERSKGLGLDMAAMIATGRFFVEQIDAAELSPGEFTHRVRACIDAHAVKTVVIDSLNGYQESMPEEQFLVLHMHELLQYLNRRGATTFLTVAQHGLVGDMKSPVDVTYLADSVILLRYFEALGHVRRAISVLKKRSGAHEDTIREYRITARGIEIGEPLQAFQGVLRGVPTYLGDDAALMAGRA